MKYYSLLIAPFVCFSQITWDGPEITFTKENYINVQDDITNDVSITRGNTGGSIFNIITESSYIPGTSPEGTLWAIGNLSDNNLAFNDFRSFDGNNKNKPPLNQNLVLKLTNGTSSNSDDIHIKVFFTSWTSNGNGGGFSYRRTTNPNLNVNMIEKNEIIIFPNPTTGLVRTNQDLIEQIRVYDLTGKQLIRSEDSSVDLSTFKNGVYLLQLYRSDTKDWVTKRLVKLE